MTVAWDTIKPALVDFIEATGAVGPDHVFWEREAQPIAYDDVVELRISAEDSIGFDDVEDVEVSPGAYAPRITGIRTFILSIRYYSRSQVTAARGALETIRASFYHPRRRQILDDAGISFLTTETLVTFDEVREERWESVAVLDVRLSVLSELFDPENDASTTDHVAAFGVSVNGEPEITIPE